MNWYNILPTKCIEHPQYMIVMFIRDLFLFHPRVRRTTKRKRHRKKCEAKEDFFNQKCSQSKLYVTQFPKTRENMYEEILILVLKGSPNKL